MKSDVNAVADELVELLISNGFTIQRYDAYSTNSIYLKLDYGVCNSIRISDHYGKKYLKYRYNIGSHISEFECKKGTYKQYFFRIDKKKNLLKKIIEERDLKIQKYGINMYQSYMRKNQMQHADEIGFWKQARLIKTI